MSDGGGISAMALVTKLQDYGLDGSVPGMKSSVELAHDYLADSSYADHEERIKSLVRWETSKTAGSGFLTGLGGLIALPATLPAGLGAAWVVQVRLVGAIAHLRGWDLADDRVRAVAVAALAGDAAVAEVTKNLGGAIAMKGGQAALSSVPGKVFIEINKKVGFRLVTKGGEKGIINMGKVVPLLGGVVGGTVDAATTRTVSLVAKRTFHPRPLDGFGCYASLDEPSAPALAA